MTFLSRDPYSLTLILQKTIHKAPQLNGEGDVLVKMYHQPHPIKHSPSMVEDVLVNLSLLVILYVSLQVPHLRLVHRALQSVHLLPLVSLSVDVHVHPSLQTLPPLPLVVRLSVDVDGHANVKIRPWTLAMKCLAQKYLNLMVIHNHQ